MRVRQIEVALDAASHGYILAAHVNKCTLLNNVMERVEQCYGYRVDSD